MNVKSQVVTLKQAKILQGLGVNQQGLFVWCVVTPDPTGENWYYEVFYKDDMSPAAIHSECLGTAFTVGELGFILKHFINYVHHIADGKYEVCIQTYLSRFDTEAEARADLLIYLIQNKIDLPK